MSHLGLLGFQISVIKTLGRDLDRHPLFDFKAEISQSVDFVRVVGEQPQGPCPKVSQDLGTDPAFPQVRGKAQFDMVCYDRPLGIGGGGAKTVYDLYDIHTWEPMRQYLDYPGAKYKNVPRPENLEKMIEIAEKIAQGFLQVRVDLYNVKGKIYFGELTLTSGNGNVLYFSQNFLNELRSYVKLN